MRLKNNAPTGPNLSGFLYGIGTIQAFIGIVNLDAVSVGMGVASLALAGVIHLSYTRNLVKPAAEPGTLTSDALYGLVEHGGPIDCDCIREVCDLIDSGNLIVIHTTADTGGGANRCER